MSIRVNQGNSSIIGARRPSGSTQKVPDFAQEISKIEDKQKSELDSLLKKVDETGEQLSKTMTLRHLREYKTALKNLLNEVAKSHGLSIEHIWNHQGQPRVLTAIRQVEKHLADLTDEVTAQSTNQIKILTRIGDIKGMIIDLFT